MQFRLFVFSILMTGSLLTTAQKPVKAKQGNDIPGKGLVLRSGIRVTARAYEDSVVLRWAPENSWAWHKLNYVGYKIERIDLSEKDKPVKTVLTSTVLKPYPLEKFKTVFRADNNNAAIAAQCLYGKNFNTNLRQGQGAIEDKASVSDARYAYTLMVSDFDAGVAEATALRFTDKTVKKGGRYFYRVVPASAVTQGIIDTGTVMMMNIKQENKRIPELKGGTAYDLVAELQWDRAANDQWSGFFIERSEDGKTYRAMNKLPFISSPPDTSELKQDSSKARLFSILKEEYVYFDSLPLNYKNYYYRIKGVDAFAEQSGYSSSITLSGKDLTPPLPVNVLTPRFTGNRSIKLTWDKKQTEPDCKGYYITRSDNINGPYETLNKEILPPGTLEYTDNNAFAHGGSYYIVVSADTASNISSSTPVMGFVPDKTPPAKPIGLKGKIEKNGLVYLSWDSNKEEDIKGYKVYFANAPDHVYTQVTTEPDSLTNFVDSITLRTLTKNIWYKIVAVDYNNNHSDFSEPLRLKKPDIVPPVPPVATNIKITAKGAEMDWIQSSSEDAVSYIVYREETGHGKIIAGSFRHNPAMASFHFIDSAIKFGIEYRYSAVTIDEDSLRSTLSIPVTVKSHKVNERNPISSIKAVYDEKINAVKLSWDYQEPGKDFFFILFKGDAVSELEPLRSLNKEATEYNDLNISNGKTYWYSIQAVYKDENGNTKLSDPVPVKIPSLK